MRTSDPSHPVLEFIPVVHSAYVTDECTAVPLRGGGPVAATFHAQTASRFVAGLRSSGRGKGSKSRSGTKATEGWSQFDMRGLPW
jgi:hypothetical protein